MLLKLLEVLQNSLVNVVLVQRKAQFCDIYAQQAQASGGHRPQTPPFESLTQLNISTLCCPQAD